MNNTNLPRKKTRAVKFALFTSALVAVLVPAITSMGGQTGTALAAGAKSAVLKTTLRTRFLIGLPKNSDFKVMSLSKPNRVVIDLPNVNIRLPAQPTTGPIGLVSSFTAGRAGPKRSLVVINVTAPVIVQNAAIERDTDSNGYVLALDIDPAGPSQTAPTKKKTAPAKFGTRFGLGAASIQPPLPRPAQTPSERDAKKAKPTIVIDPGHGGDDTGASKNGIVEKNVVLAFALTLRDKLRKTGRYNVLMTRSDDTFVSLGGRVRFAEKHRAHLFIAVHADYARSKARGATVYSLRGRTARALERSAKKYASRSVNITKDNFQPSPARGPDRSIVLGFLTDLTRKDVRRTSGLANDISSKIVRFMGDSTTLRQTPHKTAGFKVLKTAQFPSVLIELAYVTNKKDARNLASKAWRNKVSKSIVTAVDNYFESDSANFPM